MKFNVTALKGAGQLALNVAKQNAPTAMVVGGIGLMCASTYFAVKRTDKAKAIIDDWNNSMVKADELIQFYGEHPEKATEEKNIPAIQKLKTQSTIEMAVDVAKAMSPAIFAGLGGIGLILGGHGIMIRRVGMLGAALDTVAKKFEAYRGEVVDQLGEEVDKAFYFGEKVESKELELPNEDTGETEKRKVLVGSVKPTGLAVCFTESNPNWSPDARANKFFIESVQSYIQSMVTYGGQCSLAEALQRLGFHHLNDDFMDIPDSVKKTAYAIGWKRGDVVDFGLSELFAQMDDDGTIKYEPSMWIVPNCTRSMFDGKTLKAVFSRPSKQDTEVAETVAELDGVVA